MKDKTINIIEIENLTRKFGDFIAVDHIVAENSNVIPTIPGARKSRKFIPSGMPGIILAGIKLNGSPRKARKRKGINIEPASRAFTLINLFTCRNHMV
ncbi:unnamed protein product [marine sediment metagenome]|uniref:Uncharacterized protein n=1 Tax=marine sediment metagenome TaxID=412755 RepID=X1MCH5_9ZZZZ